MPRISFWFIIVSSASDVNGELLWYHLYPAAGDDSPLYSTTASAVTLAILIAQFTSCLSPGVD